jgi:hypothetical protein
MGFIIGLIVGFFLGIIVAAVLLANRDFKNVMSEGTDNVADTFKSNYKAAMKVQDEKYENEGKKKK